MTPPIASSIQFLYSSGSSSVAVATVFWSLVPPRSPAAANVPAKISTRNLRDEFVIASGSISKQWSHVGPVWFFVAAGRPTRPLLQKIRVIDVANENMSGYFLLLKMALYAEGRVTFVQQSLINRAVR